jgi:hypothetical protein
MPGIVPGGPRMSEPNAIGMPSGNVRQLLFKMVKAGEVSKTSRGHPDNNPPTPDNNANKITSEDEGRPHCETGDQNNAAAIGMRGGTSLKELSEPMTPNEIAAGRGIVRLGPIEHVEKRLEQFDIRADPVEEQERWARLAPVSNADAQHLPLEVVQAHAGLAKPILSSITAFGPIGTQPGLALRSQPSLARAKRLKHPSCPSSRFNRREGASAHKPERLSWSKVFYVAPLSEDIDLK